MPLPSDLDPEASFAAWLSDLRDLPPHQQPAQIAHALARLDAAITARETEMARLKRRREKVARLVARLRGAGQPPSPQE